MANLRQRRSNQLSEEEFLDEDDQELLVSSIEQDATEQIQSILTLFSWICYGTIGMTLILPVLGGMSVPLQGWAHASFAVLLHWMAIQIANNRLVGVLVLVPLAVTAAVMIVLFLDLVFYDGHVHWGMAICNMITWTGALYLRWEGRNTKRSLGELRESKYHYKAI